MMTVISALTATLALSGWRSATPVEKDYKTSYREAHQAAAKYRRQRDRLQVLLVNRVLEIQALRRRQARLVRAIKKEVAAVGTSRLEQSFLCIHRFEGSWTDRGAPYYGGLQMDVSFQRTYGREFYEHFGTADRWPVSAQLATAMKAYLDGRGFGPWPNTARMCGLS